MLTMKEYVEKYAGDGHSMPDAVWVHAQDLMGHVLRFDCGHTVYPSKESGNNKVRLSDGIEKYKAIDIDGFNEAFDNAFIKKNRRRAVLDIEGDLQIDQYLNESSTPFENFVKVQEESKSATSVFINMFVASGERKGPDVEQAYRECYRIAAQGESNGWPVRVIGYFPLIMDHHKSGRLQHIFVVLKDYSDPIFPAIWAGISNNDICNALVNCIVYYWIGGTHGYGGKGPGGCRDQMVMDKFCEPDEEVLTFGKYIRAHDKVNYRGYGDE